MNCFEAQTSTNNGISHFRSAQKKLRKKWNKTVTESCLMVSVYDLLSLTKNKKKYLSNIHMISNHYLWFEWVCYIFFSISFFTINKFNDLELLSKFKFTKSFHLSFSEVLKVETLLFNEKKTFWFLVSLFWVHLRIAYRKNYLQSYNPTVSKFKF